MNKASEHLNEMRDCRWQLLVRAERLGRQHMRARLNSCWDLLQQSGLRSSAEKKLPSQVVR